MKMLLRPLFLLFFALVATGCIETLQGDGVYSSFGEDTSQIHSFSASGAFETKLYVVPSQGAPGYTVEMDQNLVGYVDVAVVDGHLFLRSDEYLESLNPVTVTIYSDSFSNVNVRDHGEIRFRDVSAPYVSVNAQDSSRVVVRGAVDVLDVSANGWSDVVLDVYSSSVAVYTADDADIEADGRTSELILTTYGESDVWAGSMRSDFVVADLFDESCATVNPRESLDAVVNDFACLNYTRDPLEMLVDVLGGGSVSFSFF